MAITDTLRSCRNGHRNFVIGGFGDGGRRASARRTVPLGHPDPSVRMVQTAGWIRPSPLIAQRVSWLRSFKRQLDHQERSRNIRSTNALSQRNIRVPLDNRTPPT
jgi:hypothetical protein